MGRTPGGARKKLLAAAADVCAQRGGHALTLDSVAERAHVSKGGLLYHFPSKDALMLALLEHLAQEHAATLRGHQERHPTLSMTGSYLAVTVSGTARKDPFFAGFHAAVLDAKEVLAEWERHYRVYFEELLRESDDFSLDAILTLAIDALATNEAHGAAPLPPKLRARVLARMADLAARRRSST